MIKISANISRRRKAFLEYDFGMSPKEVCQFLGINLKTAQRYHNDYQKLPPHFFEKCRLVRKYWRTMSPNNKEKVINFLAGELGTGSEDIKEQMLQPWALKQRVTGQWKQWLVKGKHKRSQHTTQSVKKKLLEFWPEGSAKHVIQLALGQIGSVIDDD